MISALGWTIASIMVVPMAEVVFSSTASEGQSLLKRLWNVAGRYLRIFPLRASSVCCRILFPHSVDCAGPAAMVGIALRLHGWSGAVALPRSPDREKAMEQNVFMNNFVVCVA